MIELLEPILPVLIVLATLITLSGIVLIMVSIFHRWAKFFYNTGFNDGMKAQAFHDELNKEEAENDKRR